MTSRRGFLLGLGSALITAPAIVRAGSLMQVKTFKTIREIVNDGITLQATAHPIMHVGDVVMNPNGSVGGIWDGVSVLTFGEVITPASLETVWVDPGKMRRDGFRIIRR